MGEDGKFVLLVAVGAFIAFIVYDMAVGALEQFTTKE